MADWMEDAIAYCRSCFAEDSSGHDWQHTRRVCETAVRIAKAEGADEDTVRLAALLHDVDDVKLSPETAANHGRAAAFMQAHQMDPETISHVLAIIEQVSFKGTDSVIPDTPEGRCVQDADRLDAIGAIGIARVFAYGGSRGRPIWDPSETPRAGMNEQEYRNAVGSSISHFYEKLLLLRGMMTTETGRAMAEHRHRFMESFLGEFYSEWKGER